MGDPAVEAAAFATLMGLDGMRLLTTEDEFEITMMNVLANKISEMKTRQMENQAAMIATQVGRLFSK